MVYSVVRFTGSNVSPLHPSADALGYFHLVRFADTSKELLRQSRPGSTFGTLLQAGFFSCSYPVLDDRIRPEVFQ